jgi:hypothetical protein
MKITKQTQFLVKSHGISVVEGGFRWGRRFNRLWATEQTQFGPKLLVINAVQTGV